MVAGTWTGGEAQSIGKPFHITVRFLFVIIWFANSLASSDTLIFLSL